MKEYKRKNAFPISVKSRTEVAEIIKDIKESFDMSRSELANYCCVAPNTLDMVLLGRTYPPFKMLSALAQHENVKKADMYIVKSLLRNYL